MIPPELSMSTITVELTPANTFAAVIVRNDESKILSRLGHDHVIRATDFKSLVTINPEALQDLAFRLTFPVSALIVDADSDRPRVSLSGTVSSRDQRATRDNMLARGQLHAKKFPEITFQVSGATLEDRHWILNGSFSVKGTTHHFPFPVEVTNLDPFTLHGTVQLPHKDLGLTPYKAPMGALQNREELEFCVRINC